MVSMTGYAEARREGPGGTVRVEVRARNHRYREVIFHLPPGWRGLEDALRAAVPSDLERGRIEIHLAIEEFGSGGRTVKLNRGLLGGLVQAIDEAAALLGCELPPEKKLELLLRCPDIFVADEGQVGSELVALARDALAEAFFELEVARRREGERLAEDIERRLERVDLIVQEIKKRSPHVAEIHRRRLTERLAALEIPGAIDRDRLLVEVALLAERSDITEEVVRLESHLQEFRVTAGQRGAIGKKLDFLLQEMHREFHTIGAKAGTEDVIRLAVEGRSEVERVREQIQNVE